MPDNTHPQQLRLIELVRKKGIGEHMGKHLDETELVETSALFKSPHVKLSTQATLLTAILMLPPTPPEEAWISKLSSDDVPQELSPLISRNSPGGFYDTVLRVLTRNDLSTSDMTLAMQTILDSKTAPFLKAAFLEALRLKRETVEENVACLHTFYTAISPLNLKIPILIDIANPYDGYKRNPNISIAIAAVLGALGFPTLLHGLDSVSPKYGTTVHQQLQKAGKNPLKSVNEVADCLQNPTIGWGYLDQSVYFPELFNQLQLRNEMVKRPLIATLEKFLTPIQADKTYLVTGYTHPPYRMMTENILRAHPSLEDYMIIRGLEGSAILPSDRRSPIVTKSKPSSVSEFCSPEALSLSNSEWPPRANSLNLSNWIESGIEAHLETNSPYLPIIEYNVLCILTSFGLAKSTATLDKIKSTLISGKALNHWLYY